MSEIFPIFICILLALLALAFAAKYKRLEAAAQMFQALLTGVAIIIAGLWFFTERKGTTHADVRLEVTGARVSPDFILLEGEVHVKNVGHVLLNTSEWDVQLATVVPSGLALDQIAGLGLNEWPEQVGKNPAFHDNTLQWETIRHFRGAAAREVEPSESDIKNFDFLVPCTIRLARLSVMVKKPLEQSPRLPSSDRKREVTATDSTIQNTAAPGGGGERQSKEWWWKDHGLLSLTELCRKPVGTVQALYPTKP